MKDAIPLQEKCVENVLGGRDRVGDASASEKKGRNGLYYTISLHKSASQLPVPI
jgi:hypothetical protein